MWLLSSSNVPPPGPNQSTFSSQAALCPAPPHMTLSFFSQTFCGSLWPWVFPCSFLPQNRVNPGHSPAGTPTLVLSASHLLTPDGWRPCLVALLWLHTTSHYTYRDPEEYLLRKALIQSILPSRARSSHTCSLCTGHAHIEEARLQAFLAQTTPWICTRLWLFKHSQMYYLM